MRPTERLFSVVFGVSLLGAVVSPSLRTPPVDGFPLSNYPMFSVARETEAVRIVHVVAFDDAGGGRPVSPAMLGSIEVMQARQTVRIAVRKGRAASMDLCSRAATQLAEAGGSWASARRVEVRVDTYDAIAYFEGDTRPHHAEVHASCPVPGGTP
ncbi:MAG: hypothetical protein AAF721_07395 [Myxococcota bacterium]